MELYLKKFLIMPPNNSSAPVIPLSQWHRPVTYGDFQMMKQALREEILQDMRSLLAEKAPTPQKKWLRNNAVRDLLGVSAGTLQSMGDNGILPFSRIGRHFYYDAAEIEIVIEGRKGSGRQGHFLGSKECK
jgi:Helix-turn-helix domain